MVIGTVSWRTKSNKAIKGSISNTPIEIRNTCINNGRDSLHTQFTRVDQILQEMGKIISYVCSLH